MKRLLLVALLALSPLAHANFHLMKVVEVFPGTPASPNAQFVVLQMYSGGQNALGGHKVTVFDSAGNLLANGTFTFSGTVGTGADQSKILVATAQAATFFNVTADLVMANPVIPLTGGKVCFDAIPIDCVAWGGFSGPSNGTVGAVVPVLNPTSAPIVASGGLVSGKSATRRLNVSGGPGTLEASDDTNSSANDFVLLHPLPFNSAGQMGLPPPATCGNGVIEGMEQCDDNNTNDGDACSGVCSEFFEDVFADGFEDLVR